MVFIQYNTTFDFAVLGSGISGIYTTFLLSKQFPNSNILVIEKNNNPGGRVYTFKNKHMNVEAGAGRFYSGQPYIFDLIEQLDLSKRIVPIHNTYGYAPSDNTDSIHTSLFHFDDDHADLNNMKSFFQHNTAGSQQLITHSISNSFINYDTFIPIIKHGIDMFLGPNTLPCTELLLQVIVKSYSYTPKYLQSINFIELSQNFLTPNQIEYIKDSFGYYAKLVYYNAFDAIHVLKHHLNPFNTFYAMKNGLSIIISYMLLEITKNKNVVFKYNHHVDNIQYLPSSKTFKVFCSHNDGHTIFNTHKCICALPKFVLDKINLFQPIHKELSSIQCSPLCRIYAKYPKQLFNDSDGNIVKQVWFHGIKHVITTNNDLRMIVPIDQDNGIIMISYSDSHFARNWKNIHDKKGNSGVHTHISKLVKQCLDIDIPAFIDMNLFYWECGVAFWGIETDSKVNSMRISNHFKDIPLAICGEHYSQSNQQWIEGSLETAHNAFQHIKRFT